MCKFWSKMFPRLHCNQLCCFMWPTFLFLSSFTAMLLCGNAHWRTTAGPLRRRSLRQVRGSWGMLGYQHSGRCRGDTVACVYPMWHAHSQWDRKDIAHVVSKVIAGHLRRTGVLRLVCLIYFIHACLFHLIGGGNNITYYVYFKTIFAFKFEHYRRCI